MYSASKTRSVFGVLFIASSWLNIQLTLQLSSGRKPGEPDINIEYSSAENKSFVLHDSNGFEPGDADNFDTVMKFLNDRKAKPDIKDQVHAVW